GKHGDVLSFVMEFEHVTFPEAIELLARRAGITLDPVSIAKNESRAALLDVMRWASKQFHDCLLESPQADKARAYVLERGLNEETVRRWGLGFAPASGHWLVERGRNDNIPQDLLEKVGLIAPRTQGPGFYDRFRDRLQFSIRDLRGQTVGFGGRILPGSPFADRAPKYYNSCDTPLFSKSDQLYGIDQARAAGEKKGYLAIVEGYTDVLMAHQMGITQVVATMGTALNEQHVRQLRRLVPRVVLVFDADAGGEQGVDRALELFVSQDMELAVARLPAGLDPCDLLSQSGAEAFAAVLEQAVDALEFKLNEMVTRENASSVEGRRRIADAVLRVIAMANPMPGEAGAIKTELMVTRIARRLALKEETVWARWNEFRQARTSNPVNRTRSNPTPTPQAAPAAPEERRLLEILLAEPDLVKQAHGSVKPEEIAHPGLRRLLGGLFALEASGNRPTLDRLREDLADHVPLVNKAFQLQEAGVDRPDRAGELQGLLTFFSRRREKTLKDALQSQLQGVRDDSLALDLLRQIQNQTVQSGPESSSETGKPGKAHPAPSR
ncbi:MAG: DNA primase, partial [Gemmataceae bacterium]